MKMGIREFIFKNNLRVADALEVACPDIGFPKHYAVYLGYDNGVPRFIANTTGGVQLLDNSQLSEFVKEFEVTHIERFAGDSHQRKNAARRALSRIGEKAYSLVFNNCEHFKNWVLHGEDKSRQVITFGATAATASAGLIVLGNTLDSKSVKKTGLVIGLLLILFVFFAFFIWMNKQNNNTPQPYRPPDGHRG